MYKTLTGNQGGGKRHSDSKTLHVAYCLLQFTSLTHSLDTCLDFLSKSKLMICEEMNYRSKENLL